jgi:hypothetical protein
MIGVLKSEKKDSLRQQELIKWMFKMANALHFYRTAVIRGKEVRIFTIQGPLIIMPIKSHNNTYIFRQEQV